MSRTLIFLITTLAVILAATQNTFAGNPPSGSFRGFSGGMMLHTGYVSGGSVTLYDASGAQVWSEAMYGMPTGIGGALKLHFGNYVRIGTEGYSTSLSYGKFSSHSSIGWGGLLADVVFNSSGRFMPFAGVTVGGGAVKNLTLTEKIGDDFTVEQNASYRKYGFMCVVPFVGMEYAASARMRLVLKADYMINVSNPQADFATGPRVYIGFMFYHHRHR